MNPVVFLGPTLPVSEASQLLDAVFLPPARQGDIVSAVERFHPSAIGLVDGLFLQDLAVWHKEILWAMEHGIAVFGSSSMGALRASELHSFGMRGVGWVFQQYAAGLIEDDDEVVLAHGPAESGYKKLAEPLVNVRATLAAAVCHKVMTRSESEALVDVVKELYFPERTLRRLLAEAGKMLPQNRVENLREFFHSNYVDVKREDAIQLLHALRGRSVNESQSRSVNPPATVRSLFFDTMFQRDRRVAGSAGDADVSLSQIVRYAALHLRSFESIRAQAINRTLAALLADLLGIEVTEEDIRIQRKRFCHQRALRSEEAITNWLKQNDLSPGEFNELLQSIAKCQAVHSWWRATAGHRGAQAKAILDEFRLQDLYAQVLTDTAAQQKRVSRSQYADELENDTADAFRKTTEEFSSLTGFRVSIPLHQWAEEAGFLNLTDLHMELTSAVAAAHVSSPTA